MDAVQNPYVPGAGLWPPELAGRERERSLFAALLDRLEAGRGERGIVLTGYRGVGKTVLLEEFRLMAGRRGWVVAFMEAGPNGPFRLSVARALTASLRAVSLRQRASERLRRALGAFKSFSLQASPDGSMAIGIDVDPVAGRADSGDLELDLSELLVDLGVAASEMDAGVLLLVDELHELPLPDIAAVAGAAHQANRLQLPVAVSGAGLPNLPGVLIEAKSYAERLFAYHSIGALNEADAAAALSRPAEALGVTWQPDALAHAVGASGGYPYFLQAFGKQVWDYAPGPDSITADDARAGVEAAQRGLDEGFYGSRWARATPAQRAYLAAMAAEDGDGGVSSGQVAERLGKSHSDLGPHRDQLIRKGLIYPPERGTVAFTAPGMAAYIRRLKEDPNPLRRSPPALSHPSVGS